MVFGRTHEFAIKAMSEQDLPRPSAVWGQMGVWCQGRLIGNFSERYCAPYPAYRGFQELSQNLETLWMSDFEGLTDTQLWNRLDELLYGYRGDGKIEDNRTLDEVKNDAITYSITYSRFDFITNWGV